MNADQALRLYREDPSPNVAGKLYWVLKRHGRLSDWPKGKRVEGRMVFVPLERSAGQFHYRISKEYACRAVANVLQVVSYKNWRGFSETDMCSVCFSYLISSEAYRIPLAAADMLLDQQQPELWSLLPRDMRDEIRRFNDAT